MHEVAQDSSAKFSWSVLTNVTFFDAADIWVYTKMLQVEDHLNLLSAQYLVQCLDTENVCHHITKMDLPPREMKETIFTRHYQTVLPLLANNRKDTLQALHTSFVNTAIGNMKDNRVLNSRPPSINDEETLLQRRQRTTLSQLRSGHCKLLNSYKKATEAKWFFKMSRLWNGSTGCTSPVRLHSSPQWPVTCELMGQAHRDDKRTELSGPGQPELTDEDGWRGHTTTTTNTF